MPHNKSRPVTPDPAPAASARERLVLDWQTIWRSELQALAVDREAEDVLEAVLQASAAGRAVFDSGRAASPAGSDAPPRATAAAAAPDARDAILQLERRVAELERLLAGPGSGGG